MARSNHKGPEEAEQLLPMHQMELCSILSLDATKHNPIHFLSSTTILLFCGSTLILFDLDTQKQEYVWGRDGGGIGAVAVHPGGALFCLAEKSSLRSPNAYIYKYPELEIGITLRNGTEQAYTAVAFNVEGSMLATVGGFPDFMLTLWDWESAQVVLRCKAFSQEVYNVCFSPYQNGHLVTSGTGHIRFWKMTSTFTGLKLQGELGKFGKLELSDICAFVELGDGKLLSGTEFGQLLLWDGEVVKAVFTMEDGKECHSGNITVVDCDRQKGHILTAGTDGVVRVWDFTTIREAEPAEDTFYCRIAPLDEVHMMEGTSIKSMIRDRKQWVIFADSGALFRITVPDIGPVSRGPGAKSLLKFSSKPFIGLEIVDEDDLAITAAGDGSLRLYDFIEKKLEYSTLFSSPASHLLSLPPNSDQEKRTVLLGFEDGTVRSLSRCRDGWKLLSAFKPHKARVTAMALASATHYLATGSEDGRLFFFTIKDATTYNPVAYTNLDAGVCASTFTSDGASLIVACSNGRLLKVSVPPSDVEDTCLEQELEATDIFFKLLTKNLETNKEGMPKQDNTENDIIVSNSEDATEEQKEEEDIEIRIPPNDQSSPVLCLVLERGELYLSMGGSLSGKVFRCSLDTLEASLVFEGPPVPISVLKASSSGDFWLMGTENGMIRICERSDKDDQLKMPHWEKCIHDGQYGKVTGLALSRNNMYLLSVSADTTFYVQKNVGLGYQSNELPRKKSILPTKTDDLSPIVRDIVDANAYTIEEAKQKEEQDTLQAISESKKRRVKDFIQNIRCQFEGILSENKNLAHTEQIPRELFEIDTSLRHLVKEETIQRETTAAKEMQWEQEKARISVEKLKKKYLESLEFEHLSLKAFGSADSVTSFRTAKLPSGMQEHLDHLNARIEAEKTAQKEREISMGLGMSEQVPSDTAAGSGLQKVGFKTSTGDKGSTKLSKTDLRRIARKQREEAWEAHNAMKPRDGEDNPIDVEAIEEAHRTMGEFKLKTDPDYVAPEHKRMTGAPISYGW